MVEVQIMDGSSVTLHGDNGDFSITGPGHVMAPSVTCSGVSYSKGYIVVQSSSANQVIARMTGEQYNQFPMFGILLLVLGLLAGRFGYAR